MITHAGQPLVPDTPEKISPILEEVKPSSSSPTSSLRAVRKPRKTTENLDPSTSKESPNTSTEVVAKKKRGRPAKTRSDDSESDVESPKPKTSKRDKKFAVPKSSPSIQKLATDSDSPQRRKSKGEMKEFPASSSSNKVLEKVEC